MTTATTTKPSCCAICENSNLASFCQVCVNYRVDDYNSDLRVLKSKRDALYSRLARALVAKAKIEKKSHDQKAKYELLESAMNLVEKICTEQIEKYYPNLICTQSLGLMAITSKRLHKQGSCSRIWQRESYGDARPSYTSEYPLFIPRQVSCTTGGETSWTEKSSSNFGVASMESERRPRLDSSSASLKYSFASARSVELHKDLQKGISLLKRSVACITSYCCNSLCLEVPSETSTFEALAKLLTTLSSSKEVQSILSLRVASSSRSKPCQQLNTSIWKVESTVSSSTLMESAHALPAMTNAFDNYLPCFGGNSVYASEFPDSWKDET